MNRAALIIALIACAAGCRRDMFDQPKFRPLAKSEFFVDGRSARAVPAGTFAFNDTDAGEAVEQGTSKGEFIANIPITVDEPLLRRGEERFNIYCSPCHSRVGDGRGMVAKRGFLQPANLHSDRVRNAPAGYVYAVISNGYGAMPEYSDQLSIQDRWAVVAYIRVLEFSRHASPADVPPEHRRALEESK
jgi:mono/diheme cytochrome c family protein